jgi:hypothetical protein
VAETQDKAVTKSLDLTEAVSLARSYFHQLYPSVETANVLLEEVEEAPDGSYWLITLGFDTERTVRPPAPFPLINIQMPRVEQTRVYKTFKVDVASRRVVSMKIRSIE